MLESWLGTISPAKFLRDVYLQKPYAVERGATPVISNLSWETFWRVLPDCTAADLMVVRDGRLRLGSDPKTVPEGQALFQAGYSLVLRHAERHDVGLGTLALSFAEEFWAPVAIQLYATPKQHTSFGWHYDAEEVFIVQTVGTKRYLLRENTVRPRPLVDAIPQDMEFEKEHSPVTRCDLGPGDWLYVPSGFWHIARAEADSLSISIGVAAATAMDLFDELRNSFAKSAAWRQRLAPLGPHRAFMNELVEEATRILEDARTVESAIDEVRRKYALRHGAQSESSKASRLDGLQ
jgi:50S ribosomal protein L16 3-hydroxylase